MPWVRVDRELRKLSPDHKEFLCLLRDLWQNLPEVSAHARATYACMMTFENLKTNEVRTCQERLSIHLGLSVRTVRRLLRELEEVPLILTTSIRRNRKTRNTYVLLGPRPKCLSSSRNSSQKVIPFRIPKSTGSTSKTIPADGSLG